MRPSPRPFASLLLAAAITASAPAFADEADTLFDKGLAAYKEGKPEEALVSYEAAWKLRKTQDLATVLGQVEMLLGKHRDAAEHLAYALRYFPVSGKKELRTTMEKALADAKAKVTEARVSVTGDAPAHELRVDGAVIDVAVVGTSVFLLPGKHVIEASAKGYATARQTVDAKEGATVEVKLSLVPEEVAVRSRTPAYVAGGVGVASLIAGGVLLGLFQAGQADVRDRMPRAADGSPLCQRPPATGAARPECNELQAKTSEANTFGNSSIALFAIGGVAVAGAVGYLLWPNTQPASAGVTMRVAPFASREAGGVVWTGSF